MVNGAVNGAVNEKNGDAVCQPELIVLVRYGEISLKGKNRPVFENKLLSNIRAALAGVGEFKIFKLQGRLMLEFRKADAREALDRLGRVFGVVSFSPVIRVQAEWELISQAAVLSLQGGLERKALIPGERGETVSFRVTVKRADKSFPLTSIELGRELGAHLLRQVPGLRVDLHQPQLVVSVDVREGKAYLFSETLPGPGGLPVGVSGKGMLLLSGGIDSPVAGWMSMKRGIGLEAVHFHSFPFTGDRSKEKVVDLCRVLALYGGQVILHVVHFTDIQKAIHKNCPEELRITIMRRFMFRIAQQLAVSRKALALITGESVGQVASQTLESMAVINEVSAMPVLRPLVGFDKRQIIDLAEKIGTYDISIRPYEDCCTLFLPKHPSTKPRLEQVQTAEKALEEALGEVLGIKNLIAGAMEKTETLKFTGN